RSNKQTIKRRSRKTIKNEVTLIHLSHSMTLARLLDTTLSENRHRRAVAERLVKATLVVEGDPFANAGSSFAPVGVALEVDVLALERAPEAFDEHVVHPAAAAVHRDADAGVD